MVAEDNVEESHQSNNEVSQYADVDKCPLQRDGRYYCIC